MAYYTEEKASTAFTKESNDLINSYDPTASAVFAITLAEQKGDTVLAVQSFKNVLLCGSK